MEPLAIGSAVIGIISASIRIGKPLYDLAVGLTDAPKSAVALHAELNDITSALERLQTYLIGAERTDVARRSLLSLRNIVATLTGCVTTYSELEELVRKCTSNGEVSGAIERAKWVFYEHEIDGVVGRLQNHKASLTLMLATLQCESMLEAQQSMLRLEDMVASILESNKDLRIRMDILDSDHSATFSTAALQTRRARNTFIPKAFEDELNKSRVYRRVEERPMSLYSLSSTQRESLAMSAFSDLSLGNVSIISVLCLPVWSSDLSNGRHYRFGQAGLELTMSELEEQYPDINFQRNASDSEENTEEQPQDRIEQEIMLPRVPPPSNTNEQVTSVGHTSQAKFNLWMPIADGPPTQANAYPGELGLDDEAEDEPEVLFLAASLFEFNMAYERREGGIPYLQYAPGEIFDVIGEKGELWLARNQDDPQRTVGWIWEKHCARVLPEDE